MERRENGKMLRSFHPHCCPSGEGLSRRGFLTGLGGAALGAWAFQGIPWSSLAAAEPEAIPARKPLIVKPVFMYGTYSHRPQTSWRPWGGVETQKDADAEIGRIKGEIEKLRARAEFPVTILDLAPVRGGGEVANIADLKDADVVVVYAAGGGGDVLTALAATGKHIVFFVRHRSGPIYLWYEIVHPRFLRAHTDALAQKGADYLDVVVDSQDEILMRLRALCGLKNTLGTRIIAIGGPGGWATANAPQLAREVWKLDIQTVTYEELGKLYRQAREDAEAVSLAKKRTDEYLKADGVSLETDREFVWKAFLLEQVFSSIMAKAGARALTINSCMGTIMPVTETTGCLPLTLLNDAGHLAFCESDFVVIPSGILLSSIASKPVFFHNPTYPHDGIITMAHCTAPRKMDGKSLDPVRIMTHMESDYGAAPKVEMRKGQKVSMINPDFAEKRWMGVSGEILEAPFYPICRSQIEVKFDGDTRELMESMAGFHWMTVYGDFLREAEYALRKTPVAWKRLT